MPFHPTEFSPKNYLLHEKGGNFTDNILPIALA